MRKRILNALAWCLVLVMFALGVSACGHTGGTFCSISKPIRLSEKSVDALTDREVAAILAQNEKIQRLCGVKP